MIRSDSGELSLKSTSAESQTSTFSNRLSNVSHKRRRVSHLLLVGGWLGVLLAGCRPCPNATKVTCSGASWVLRPPCCCCLRVSSLCSGGRSQTRLPRRSSCPEKRGKGRGWFICSFQPLTERTQVSATCLLVEFERVAERVQALWLLGVCVPEGLRGRFEEVLVVAHLGYWHAVELVWKSQQISIKGRFFDADLQSLLA